MYRIFATALAGPASGHLWQIQLQLAGFLDLADFSTAISVCELLTAISNENGLCKSSFE